MEFSIATLLAQFVDDKLVAGKSLEKKLGCEDEDSIQKLQVTLDALEKIDVLVQWARVDTTVQPAAPQIAAREAIAIPGFHRSSRASCQEW